MARRKRKRTKKDRRTPLAPTLGFGLPLALGKPFGWSSPAEAIAEGNLGKAAQSAIGNLIGVKVGVPGTGYTAGIEANITQILNPLDFNAAGAIKGLVLGALVSKIVGTKFGVNRTMKKIPFLGKYIKL